MLLLILVGCGPDTDKIFVPADDLLEKEPATVQVPDTEKLPTLNQTIESEVLPAEPEEELSKEEQVWRGRVEKALAPSPCPDIPKPEYPSTYYQGPLTDTHVHIPSIPDWSPDEEDDLSPDMLEGRFGGTEAYLGWNVKMSEIACTLNIATTKNFAFFPAYEGEIFLHQLEIWHRTMEQYPEQFTPFIMSSGNDGDPDGFPTVDAETLKKMLAVYPDLFEGYGEIGLYARENGGSPALAPDAPRMQEIYPLIRQNKMVVYFHLGDDHKASFERTLKANPDLNFIWHGDQLSMDEIEDILSKYPNAYYGIEAYQEGNYGIFPLIVEKDKQAYLEAMEKDFDGIVKAAIRTWKPFIERHPDQVLWDTDIGDTVWNYDADAYAMMVKFARAFIGKLDPAVQEKFAYKNAERLIISN